MRLPISVRAAARTALARPRVGRAISRLASRVGTEQLIERVDRARSTRDRVIVRLPAPRGQARVSAFTMARLGDRDQVARAIRHGGFSAFEHPLPTVLCALLRDQPGTFFDVGANTGFYALLAITASPDMQVVAFEPVEEIAELLTANVAVNDAGDRIEVHRVAVSDRSGSCTLYLPPPQADGTIETSASLDAGFKEEVESRTVVAATTLDDAWEQSARPDVVFVKLDIEGCEAEALAGSAALIGTCRPTISVEVLAHRDPTPIERERRRHDLIDVALSEDEAIVGGTVEASLAAPNHLLVPLERLDELRGALDAVGLSISGPSGSCQSRPAP